LESFQIPKILTNKEYTFKCSSGYKASQAAYEYFQKGFKTYWLG
jgi:rhodanese-related sulfurtransferase